MAHNMDRSAIDAAAEAAAAAIEPPAPTDNDNALPFLAYGAEGEDVTKLVDLLALLGYATNDVVHGNGSQLNESVLADLRAAQLALDVHEQPYDQAVTSIPNGVFGELVTQTTWDALYEAAAAKVEAEQAQPEAAGAGAAGEAS